MARKATEAAATEKPAAKKEPHAPHEEGDASRSCSSLGARRGARVLHPPRGGRRPDRELAARRARARRRREAPDGTTSAGRSRPSRAAPLNFLAGSQGAADLLWSVFYLRYLRNELVRRRARTIVTLLGLGLGVALVIVISSLSNGLDQAQAKTLDPLAGIGTDLTVTLQPQQQDTTAVRRRRLRRPGRRRRRREPRPDPGEPVGRHRPVEARQARHALRPRLLPAGHAADLQAERGAADRVDQRRRQGDAGADAARRAPGGRRPEDRREAEDRRRRRSRSQRNIPRPTAAQFAQMQACFAQAARHRAAAAPAAAAATRSGGGGFGGGGGGGFGGGGANRGAFQKCLPEVAAAVAHALHDAEPDAHAGPEPAADEHHDDRVHDRRRRPEPTRRWASSPTAQVTKGTLPLAGRRPRGAGLDGLRREAFAEGRLEARPERHDVHGRRARQPAARRPERRRLPAAEAAADAREREGPRERRARPRRLELERRRR